MTQTPLLGLDSNKTRVRIHMGSTCKPRFLKRVGGSPIKVGCFPQQGNDELRIQYTCKFGKSPLQCNTICCYVHKSNVICEL